MSSDQDGETYMACIKELASGADGRKCVKTSDLFVLLPGRLYSPFKPESVEDFKRKKDYGRIKEENGSQVMYKVWILAMAETKEELIALDKHKQIKVPTRQSLGDEKVPLKEFKLANERNLEKLMKTQVRSSKAKVKVNDELEIKRKFSKKLQRRTVTANDITPASSSGGQINPGKGYEKDIMTMMGESVTTNSTESTPGNVQPGLENAEPAVESCVSQAIPGNVQPDLENAEPAVSQSSPGDVEIVTVPLQSTRQTSSDGNSTLNMPGGGQSGVESVKVPLQSTQQSSSDGDSTLNMPSVVTDGMAQVISLIEQKFAQLREHLPSLVKTAVVEALKIKMPVADSGPPSRSKPSTSKGNCVKNAINLGDTTYTALDGSLQEVPEGQVYCGAYNGKDILVSYREIQYLVGRDERLQFKVSNLAELILGEDVKQYGLKPPKDSPLTQIPTYFITAIKNMLNEWATKEREPGSDGVYIRLLNEGNIKEKLKHTFYNCQKEKRSETDQEDSAPKKKRRITKQPTTSQERTTKTNEGEAVMSTNTTNSVAEESGDTHVTDDSDKRHEAEGEEGHELKTQTSDM